jgi:hypothetical protein
MQRLYDSYENMPLGAKVALFEFRMEDANYNLSLTGKCYVYLE